MEIGLNRLIHVKKFVLGFPNENSGFVLVFFDGYVGDGAQGFKTGHLIVHAVWSR